LTTRLILWHARAQRRHKLHIFAASQQAYSPAGDGGFAVFDTGLQAMAFAKELGNYAASKDIIIRTGIHQGEVAFTKRGAVGPAVCAPTRSPQERRTTASLFSRMYGAIWIESRKKTGELQKLPRIYWPSNLL